MSTTFNKYRSLPYGSTVCTVFYGAGGGGGKLSAGLKWAVLTLS